MASYRLASICGKFNHRKQANRFFKVQWSLSPQSPRFESHLSSINFQVFYVIVHNGPKLTCTLTYLGEKGILGEPDFLCIQKALFIKNHGKNDFNMTSLKRFNSFYLYTLLVMMKRVHSLYVYTINLWFQPKITITFTL